MNSEKLLRICIDCKAIEINEIYWLREKSFTDLYESFMERYKGKLSHSHCSRHARRYEREMNRELKKLKG